MSEPVPQCPLCGASATRVFRVAEMMFGTGEQFDYAECSGCGCLWLVSPPGDMRAHYPDTYEAHTTREIGLVRRIARQWRNRAALGRGIAGRLLNRRTPNIRMGALKPLGVSRKSRILDVGCGDGQVVRDLRDLGFHNARGIDPHLHDSALGEGLERANLEDVDGRWDVITLHHSFEHLQDPAAAMANIARLLSDGGVCLIRTPIVPSAAWRKYGVHWVQLDAPRHYFIHSITSLEKLGEAAGLNVVDVVHDSGALQFWGSKQYQAGFALSDPETGRLGPRSDLFDRNELAAFARRAAALNRAAQGDQAAVYLRKATA